MNNIELTNNLATNFSTLTEDELIGTEGGSVFAMAIGLAGLAYTIGKDLKRKYG